MFLWYEGTNGLKTYLKLQSITIKSSWEGKVFIKNGLKDPGNVKVYSKT